MKKIILCPNSVRDNGLKLAAEVLRLLEDCGVETVCCPVFEQSAESLPDKYAVSALSDAIKDAYMIIAFGGDGTMLHTARAVAEYNIPMLGINMGKKGFLADIEKSEIDLVKKAVAGDFDIDRRLMLDAEVIRDGECIYSNFALNEVMVGGMARMIDIRVSADGKPVTAFSGDGVVIATPTGSTAYSMSAGGPIVEPTAENILVTPVCAHALIAKALVLEPGRVVTIEPDRLLSKSAYVTLDGSDPQKLYEGDIVKIRRSKYETKLVHVSQRSFYEKISEKLGEKS